MKKLSNPVALSIVDGVCACRYLDVVDVASLEVGRRVAPPVANRPDVEVGVGGIHRVSGER